MEDCTMEASLSIPPSQVQSDASADATTISSSAAATAAVSTVTTHPVPDDSCEAVPSSSSRPSPEIMRCIRALQDADDEENDNQKFAALMLVTKLIKAETLDVKSMVKLFEAIGMNFLIKLLRDDNLPEGCPSFIFKSVSLSILTSFITTGYKRAVFYEIIPDLLKIIIDSKSSESNLVVVQDAFQCLTAIAAHRSGRRAIIRRDGLCCLVDVYVEENFCQEFSLQLLLGIMSSEGQSTWLNNLEAFTKLVEHLCAEFSHDQSERKFELCLPLAEVVRTMPETVPGEDGYTWQQQLHSGLTDILLSKLGKEQRNLGLLLASAALDSMGAAWVVVSGPKGHHLLLIMVHLACVEVRMSLENEKLEQSFAMAPQTTSCYLILENAIKFLVNGALQMEEKQKQQLYAALKGAFNAVMLFLKETSEDRVPTEDISTQMFVCATIRVLAAWLAEETSANKEEVYALLPFLMDMAKYNFNWNKKMAAAADVVSSNISSNKTKKRSKSSGSTTVNPELPDLLRFLLPGLCHLTAEDEPRHTLLELNIEQLLMDYFTMKYKEFSRIVGPKTCEERYSMTVNELELVCDTLVTTCSIFMNIVVTAPEAVQTKPIYLELLKFIFDKVPLIGQNFIFLPLRGNMCVLGLMILRHQVGNLRNTEHSNFRYIKTTVSFLWDAHNIEESPDQNSLVVSSLYLNQWGTLMELWYLGMNNLKVLASHISWVCDFLVECDWPQTIARTLAQVRAGGVDPTLLTALEDLLCVIVRSSKAARDTLIAEKILTVATMHEMTNLVREMT